MVIPKTIRRDLKIRPGTELAVERIDQRSFSVSVAPHLSHRAQVAQLVGMFRRPGRRRKPLSVEEMDRAIGRIVLEDDERTKTRGSRRR